MSVLPDTPTDARTLNDDEIAGAVAAEVDQLALALDSPEAIARSLAAFITKNYPRYVSTAYWVVLNHLRDPTTANVRDKGIAVTIAKIPFALQLKAILGSTTAGIGVFPRPFDVATLHAKFAVGAGVALPYDDAHHLAPFVGFTVSFS